MKIYVLILLFTYILTSYYIGCSANECYKDLGCFSQRYPWVSPSRPFPPPDNPRHINVTLLFFSREQKEGQWITIYPDIAFNVTGFKNDRRTVTITHGFASSATVDWVMEMKDKYLENLDANIFLVNWSEGADFVNYFRAAANARVAGAVLGRFGKHLIYEHGVNYSNFHLIGHSLGSHISGYAAQIMNDAARNRKKVSRITALDPAQPGFQSLPDEVRLSQENADFVEAIHSDAKLFLPFFGFGYITEIGHLDFFLNRGYDQPKCIDLEPLLNLTSILQLKSITVELISNAISCSHGRAYEIFTSAIDPSVKCNFTGHRLITRFPIISNQYSCGREGSNCIDIGLDTPSHKPRGMFQVMTTGRKPYCCYDYSLIRGCSGTQK